MLIIAIYELRKLFREKTTLIINFLLPLLLIFILGAALSDLFTLKDQEIQQVKLVVHQQDEGILKPSVKEFLHSPDVRDYLQYHEVNSREEAVSAIKAGDADFGLIVPRNFSEDAAAGQSVSWEFIRGNDRITNLTAETILQSFLTQANMMQSAAIVFGPESMLSTAGLVRSEETNVQVGQLSRSDKEFTATQYYAAAMLVMFLLYSGMGTAISLVIEKENHTLARLTSMPIRPHQIMFGKLLGNGLLSALQAFVIIAATTLLYGVDWGRDIMLLAGIVLLIILASISVAIITATLFKTTKEIVIVFQTIIIIMTFLSGGFSPELGSFIEKLGKFTLSHWASDGLLQMMLYSESSMLYNHLFILGTIGIVLLSAAVILYRKVGYHA
jgi:ABC-2 type transport system permease protein